MHIMPYKDKDKAREASRLAQQRRRAKLQANGVCTRCAKNPASEFELCIQCREAYKGYSAQRYHTKQKQNKQKVFDHYGWECKCCGESELHFLTIDHINGITDEPKSCRAGSSFYWYIVKQGFPDKYQTLCFNCNGAKGKLGFCPHTRK